MTKQEEVTPSGEQPKFTRGPWSAHTILSGSENHKGWRVFAATGYPVAEVYPLNTDPSPAARANARLIAGAPALYDAAQVALSIIETGDPRDATVFLQQALALVDAPQETK
jgi:hypothetical protein